MKKEIYMKTMINIINVEEKVEEELLEMLK
jgi:hypothetical protein